MPPASFLIKPVSGRCNLACSYCFYRDEAAHRGKADYGRMALDTARRLVQEALAFADGTCTFAFQGGEPTLAGLGFYREFARMVKEGNSRRLGIRLSLQTNGLLIDAEWAAFLRDEGFLVGLSLDGPRLLHDLFRKAPDGSGSHARVMGAARILKEAGTDFNVLCVVDEVTAANPLVVHDFFRRHGFTWVQYIPLIEPLDGPEGGGSVPLSPSSWGAFLKTVFDAWYGDLRSGDETSVRWFDNLVDMALGNPPESCGMSGGCRATFTVESDGSVFPCDFYALDEWRMGGIGVESLAAMMASGAARRFVRSSLPVSQECEGCFAFALCRGGCRRDREPFEAGTPRLNRLCRGYKDFFAYAGTRIMSLAAEVRASRGHGYEPGR